MGERSEKPTRCGCALGSGPREERGRSLVRRQAYLGLSTLEGLTKGEGRENFYRK